MSYSVSLPERGTFEAWRSAARLAISHRIPPDQIDWTGSGGLFAAAALPDEAGPHQARVPEAFVKLAGSVIWHSAPERLSLLYQALWRIDRRDGDPLSQADPLGRRLQLLAKSVGFLKEETQLAQEKEPGTKPSLTDGAAQRKWQVPTEFPRCPKPGSQSDLQTYAAAISTGDVFCRNQFGDVLVLAKGWTPDGSGLLIMSQMPESAQKHWALAQITLEDGVFVHANCGSFFTEDGAQKYFALVQGLEWTGGETFDDYC